MSRYNLKRQYKKKKRTSKKHLSLQKRFIKKLKKSLYRTKSDREAVELAKKIQYTPQYTSYKGKTRKKVCDYTVWEKLNGDDEDNLYYVQPFLSVMRKVISDKFEIEEWYYDGCSYSDGNYLILDFVHKQDYDDYFGLKKDVKIRCLDFLCSHNTLYAQPHKLVPDSGALEIIAVKTCREAVSYDEV